MIALLEWKQVVQCCIVGAFSGREEWVTRVFSFVVVVIEIVVGVVYGGGFLAGGVVGSVPG